MLAPDEEQQPLGYSQLGTALILTVTGGMAEVARAWQAAASYSHRHAPNPGRRTSGDEAMV